MSAKATPFNFPKKAPAFFAGLERNNNKAWFEAHKDEYTENVLEPLKILVTGLGAVLSPKLPGLRSAPKVNGSIFRIYRDTRFSKDKRPYKAHAGAFLWVGEGPKLARPGVYFQLDARHVLLGAGIYMFGKDGLDRYRRYAAVNGGALDRAIKKAEKAGFETGGEALKRVPRPYPQDHEHAEFLKMKGLHVSKTFAASRATRGDLIGWLRKEYAPTFDLIKQLEKAV